MIFYSLIVNVGHAATASSFEAIVSTQRPFASTQRQVLRLGLYVMVPVAFWASALAAGLSAPGAALTSVLSAIETSSVMATS